MHKLKTTIVGLFFMHKIMKGGENLKGFITQQGYWGFVEGKWMLFATESDYLDYLTET